MVAFPSLKGQGMIAIDIESKDPELKERGPGSHRDDTHIAGVAVATEAGYREYYPVGHEHGPNLDKAKVYKWLNRELADPNVPKCGANLLYDYLFLEAAGVQVKGMLYDIQIAEPLLCETRFNYSLEALAQDYLGTGKVDYELDKWLVEHFGKKNPKANIWRAPPELVRPYAIGDVDLPLKVFAIQRKQLEKEGLWELFIMESKLIPMLAAMRKRGVKVDVKAAQKLRAKYVKDQDAMEAEIKRVTGLQVDIWAADSIAKAFDGLGVEYPLTAKTKKPSFTKGFLENSETPIAKMIVEARRMDKMKGTFLDGCIINGSDNGRVHCQFNQLKGEAGGAVSGRFSSSNPNLQFIPVRTTEGKMIRKMFKPDDGQHWYKLDYSQIEYRLLVHDAAELDLKGARDVAALYHTDKGIDFHEVVAQMTGLSRSAAKTVNFGIAYGEGIKKLAYSLGLTLAKAEELLEEYHRRAPFMRPLSRTAMNQAKNKGVVETLLGRKRRFDAWQSWNRKTNETIITQWKVPGSQRAFTHKALNARTQGSAADIMKLAMVEAWESGVYDYLGVSQLTVHDELDGSFEPNKKGLAAVRELQNIMESVVELRVPMKVDLSKGLDWGSAD